MDGDSPVTVAQMAQVAQWLERIYRRVPEGTAEDVVSDVVMAWLATGYQPKDVMRDLHQASRHRMIDVYRAYRRQRGEQQKNGAKTWKARQRGWEWESHRCPMMDPERLVRARAMLRYMAQCLTEEEWQVLLWADGVRESCVELAPMIGRTPTATKIVVYELRKCVQQICTRYEQGDAPARTPTKRVIAWRQTTCLMAGGLNKGQDGSPSR